MGFLGALRDQVFTLGDSLHTSLAVRPEMKHETW